MADTRSQFTFYDSFYRAVSRIRKKADKADAYDAIVAYALLGEEPDLDKLPDAAAIAFEVIRPNLDASRRKAASGKQGGKAKKQTESKPEANESKSEANRKQEKEQEKVKEQDKDKEQMLYTPIPPKGASPVPEQPEVDLSGLSPFVQAKLNQWLAYKKERRESYKPTGLQALVTRIRSAVDKYGEVAVCELIDNSMSSGYQGILFDRLQQQKRGRKEMVPAWASQPSQRALDAVSRMMGNDGKTVGNDPELAERAEKLREQLNGG